MHFEPEELEERVSDGLQSLVPKLCCRTGWEANNEKLIGLKRSSKEEVPCKQRSLLVNNGQLSKFQHALLVQVADKYCSTTGTSEQTSE